MQVQLKGTPPFPNNRFANDDDDVRDLADAFVAQWAEHEEVLSSDALPYLDGLIDAILSRKPIDANGLTAKLHQMVPGLLLGTARRLVNLKFGNPPATQLLTAAD